MKQSHLKIDDRFEKLAVYQLRKIKQMEKEQEKLRIEQLTFLNDLRTEIIEEVKNKKSMDDILSPKQVAKEYQVSRKTFDRMVNNGLQVLQSHFGASVRVKRENLENFLNDKYHVR
ncbi:hypothetical protein [Gramella sp. MAR_2010_147]|uniref:hypothetical protein n=1 Tax=Gramella sp. MAR_2010_147 TaxID=1250205 RepID=UPI00087AA586|nr:hypothetical protein [Gramella sp. MAR_2010_147]SDS06250.1 hypothetical protein SAMN04488553_1379 [Gramella sp. MAR_2010_147]